VARIDFDPTAQEPMQPLGALPKGRYLVIIDGSEVKENAKKTGYFLQFAATVVEPTEHANRPLFALRYNISHQNPQAEQIAKRELAALCLAVGISRPVDDSEELHSKMVTVDLDVETDDQGRETNRVKAYIARDKAAPAAPAAASKPAAAAPPAKAAPPWAKAKAA
jgi:hypothetical protein